MEDIIVKEDAEVGVDTISLVIPVRVTMLSTSGELEYTTSIDEIGQIILTPNGVEDEFVAVERIPEDSIAEIDYDLETKVVEDKTYLSKVLVFDTTMLTETQTADYTLFIDAIGQCVISPDNNKNTFITVAKKDSLNLITESVKSEKYFNYTLVNSGDGWDVYNKDNELIEEGIATLSEAKVFVCKHELALLQGTLDEGVVASEQPLENEKPVNVKAEVITETIIDKDEKTTLSPDEVAEELNKVTNEFRELRGAIYCDNEEELEECLNLLDAAYETVNYKKDGSGFVVAYSTPNKKLHETFSKNDREGIINKFMKGELTILPTEDTDISNFIHLHELDDAEYEYYYDPETNVMTHRTRR